MYFKNLKVYQIIKVDALETSIHIPATISIELENSIIFWYFFPTLAKHDENQNLKERKSSLLKLKILTIYH